MTILFFSRLFYPHIGGVEKHVLEISKRLIEKGHQVIVVAEKHEEGLKDKEVTEGIKVYRIKRGESEWLKKFKIWIWLFRNLFLIRQADIIHCHDVFFWYLPFRFLFPKKPVYTTFHGYESYPIQKKAILQRRMAEVLSFGNICVGDFINKWYGTKPTYTTYGGVEQSTMNHEPLTKHSAVFVGRLDEQTGILTYVKALKLIKKKMPDFKLTVFGDGKFKNRIKNEVGFRGFSKNSQKEIYRYNFVFASRYLSVLEAMAARRLVFAVYDNSLKEDYLKMAPFAKLIIIEGRPEALANKVFYYLNNPLEKQKIIQSAFNWVKNQSFENVTNLYLKLWAKK